MVLLPMPQLEIASGYRVGNLRDPDFAVNGGRGFFITVGARLGYDDDGQTPNTLITLLDYEPVPIVFEVRGLPKNGVIAMRIEIVEQMNHLCRQTMETQNK